MKAKQNNYFHLLIPFDEDIVLMCPVIIRKSDIDICKQEEKAIIELLDMTLENAKHALKYKLFDYAIPKETK